MSVYAFSIENFKRPKEEVDHLLSMAERQLSRLQSSIGYYDFDLHIVGDLVLLPRPVSELCEQVNRVQKRHKRLLNVCAPYTSTNEMIKNYPLINSPNMIVRTSGERRLSEFMLWQVCDSVVKL
jgi:ditrans,polycis-polyprenyl diphosphate synthase